MELILKKVKFRRSSNTIIFTIPVREYYKLPAYFEGNIQIDDIKERIKESMGKPKKRKGIDTLNHLNDLERNQLENIRKSIKHMRID